MKRTLAVFDDSTLSPQATHYVRVGEVVASVTGAHQDISRVVEAMQEAGANALEDTPPEGAHVAIAVSPAGALRGDTRDDPRAAKRVTLGSAREGFARWWVHSLLGER